MWRKAGDRFSRQKSATNGCEAGSGEGKQGLPLAQPPLRLLHPRCAGLVVGSGVCSRERLVALMVWRKAGDQLRFGVGLKGRPIGHKGEKQGLPLPWEGTPLALRGRRPCSCSPSLHPKGKKSKKNETGAKSKAFPLPGFFWPLVLSYWLAWDCVVVGGFSQQGPNSQWPPTFKTCPLEK
jgi:hypothetical protein